MQLEWTRGVGDDQWKIYSLAIQALRAAGVRFLLGGGFALAAYIGRWRNTKDIDLYIFPGDRDQAVRALTEAGFADYFRQLAYDRRWIYRATRSGVIVDLIWAMANQRAQVDEEWFENAPTLAIREEKLLVVPREELLWCKLYIVQRDHCDWTDLLNLLYAAGQRLNWRRLLARLEDDWPVLKALLTVYGWLCPRRARALPMELRRKLRLDRPQVPRRKKWDRIHLLDSRGWFAALLAENEPLHI